jgi:DNA-binding beta-propeller fold protein YncE
MSLSTMVRTLPALGIIILASLTMTAEHSSDPGYHVRKRLVIDSGSAQFLLVDATNRHLFGAGTTVIDIDHSTIVDHLPLHSGHGFALAPDLNVAISRVGAVVDLSTLKVVRKIPVEGASVAYDQLTHRALFLGSSESDEPPAIYSYSEVDLTNASVIFKGQLPDEPQYVVSDNNGHFFGVIAGLREVVRIDAQSPQTVDHWSVDSCLWPHSIAIDVANSRLFLACHRSVTIADAATGRVITAFRTTGVETKQNAFDPETGLLFNPNGDGTMTVIHEDSPDHFTLVGTDQSAEADAVAAVDEKTHQVFSFHVVGKGMRVMMLSPSQSPPN